MYVQLCLSPAGSTGQGITATHDSFLMYTEDANETQAWVNAIIRVMYEVSVCMRLCMCVYIVYMHTYEDGNISILLHSRMVVPCLDDLLQIRLN